jgi:hypothetical protein
MRDDSKEQTKRTHMKIQSTAAIFAVALATTLVSANAQEEARPEGRQRPVHPVVAALDTNKDGVIDDKEIAAAPTALKALDKNSDGKLTREEIVPPRGEGRGGREGRGPRGGDDKKPE